MGVLQRELNIKVVFFNWGITDVHQKFYARQVHNAAIHTLMLHYGSCKMSAMSSVF